MTINRYKLRDDKTKKRKLQQKKKKIEDTKKSQMEILELKNTVSEFLKTFSGWT